MGRRRATRPLSGEALVDNFVGPPTQPVAAAGGDPEAAAIPGPQHEPEPEPEPEPPSHIVLREHREAALNAFYERYPAQGKTPAEVRALVANNGVPITPTNRYLVLGSASVRESIGCEQPHVGTRLELGDIVVALDEQTVGRELWVAIDRGGSQLQWVAARSSDPDDFASDEAAAASHARQTNTTTARQNIPAARPAPSARRGAKQQGGEDDAPGSLLLEKIPDGLFDTLPRRYTVTDAPIPVHTGPALDSATVAESSELQQGDEILGLERRIVFGGRKKSKPRLKTAKARIRFERGGQAANWVDEASLQLVPPIDNTWYDELCEQLMRIEANPRHESPEQVLASKKQLKDTKLWGKLNAKNITAANEELQRRKCCCCTWHRKGKPHGIDDLAAARATNRGRGFCKLDGCLPDFRHRLRDSLQTLVAGKANWHGTGSGAGMLAFLSSPFLFQAVCCTTIYATGPDSILTVVSIFMFVNIFCLLPAEVKIRNLQKKHKNRYTKDDGDTQPPVPVDEMDDYQAREHQENERLAQEQSMEIATKEAIASVGRIWGSVWIYTALLTLVPASLVVSTAHTGEAAALGIIIYVALLWCIGWVYMWFHTDHLEMIEPHQRLHRMPPDPVIWMKMLAVMLECYNYMGFSFFPAVPWSSMKVPGNVPDPQQVMMLGFFQFGDISVHNISVHQLMFWISCAMILLGFFAFHKTRNDVGKNLLVIQLFFELAAFPIIKKMTGALTCTSMFKWVFTRQGSLRSCQLEHYDYVEPGSQCMDEAPNVVCWGEEHLLLYVAPVMIVLAPYYIACVDFQSSSQAKQSIVVIDRVCGIVSFQFKFMLAFIASAMGDCYPWVMVASIEIAVLFQLFLTTYDREYTSVLTINAVRVAGLGMASINGFYASFVVYYFGASPGSSTGACVVSETPPNLTAVSDYSADDSCTHRGQALGLNGVCDADSGACSDNTDCSDCRTCGQAPIQSYSIFFGLLAANLIAVLFAFCWYKKKLVGWESTEVISKNSSDVVQVDYPVLKRRLELVQEKLSDSHGSEFSWSSYDRFKLGFDRGLLYAQAQAVWEWVDKDGRETLDLSELHTLCKALRASKALPYLIDIDRIKNTFNLESDAANNTVKVTEAHFFAVLERAQRSHAVDEHNRPKQKFCSSAKSKVCLCYSSAVPGPKRDVPLAIPLREHREKYNICEACEVRGWFYALKHSKGLVPTRIPADFPREKKLVELLSNEVGASIKEADKNAPVVEDSHELDYMHKAGRTLEAAAHATSKLGMFGGAARIAPVNMAPLGVGSDTPATKPTKIAGEATDRAETEDDAAMRIQSTISGHPAPTVSHTEKDIQDAMMMLENRKDFQAGLRQGLNWLDIDTDWSVNDSKEPVSYWKETASEQAWSKSKSFFLYVSEYSIVQDAYELQRSEHARHESARLRAALNNHADEVEAVDIIAGEDQNCDLSQAGTHMSGSVKEKGRVDVGNVLSSAMNLVQDGTKMASSAAQEVARIGLKQLDKTVSAAKSGITHLHSHGLGLEDIKRTTSEFADKGLDDVNMISRLAGLAKGIGDESLDTVTANRANGQQIEGASLKMLFRGVGERKRRIVVNKKYKENVAAKVRRESAQAIERVRRTSVEAFGSLASLANDQVRPPDPHTPFWRVRLDIRDVDVSTAGGLLLMKTLKKMHSHIQLTLTKGYKARLKTLCTTKHLGPAIIEKLRIKRMVGDDLKCYAPVIFSRFLRIESVDLSGVDMRRHFHVLVESLPDSGIRTLDLRYCGITASFMRSFAEKLVLQQSAGASASPAAAILVHGDETDFHDEQNNDVPEDVSPERACCSLCRIDDVTAPSRQWSVETRDSGQFNNLSRALCATIDAEVEKLSRWHPPLECTKWTTSVDVDGLDAESGNVHCIELTGWSDTGVEKSSLTHRMVVEISSVHMDVDGSANGLGPWTSLHEASKATRIDCSEIYQRCNATREIARGTESCESNEWLRTVHDILPYSAVCDPDADETSVRSKPNSGLNTNRKPQLEQTEESRQAFYVRQIAGFSGRWSFHSYSLDAERVQFEEVAQTLSARRVQWKERKRHVAKPLAFVHEVEWRWMDVRRKVGAMLWNPKATRPALLTNNSALLMSRKNMQRPLMLRWRTLSGMLVEMVFKNRRELAMAWPDQNSNQVCEYCGLPISPSMKLMNAVAERNRHKPESKKETWPEDKRRAKWKLGRNIESLTSLNIVGNPLGSSCQDMIHILEDSPSLQTLCGLEPSQTVVDWSPSDQDQRKKTLVDCMLLAADIKVARAAKKVATVSLSRNPLFPHLKEYEGSETGKESDRDVLVEQEKMQWMYICKVLKESSDRIACGLRKFEAYDTGLHGAAARILVEHGLRTEKQLVPDRHDPSKMIVHEGLRALHLELNPLGLDGGEAVANLMTDAHVGLKQIVVGGLIGGHRHAVIDVNNSRCEELNLSGALLEPGEILIVAAAIATLPNLKSLSIGEEKTLDNPTPHAKYELDAEWDRLDFTAEKYSNMLRADFLLIGAWIGKNNVSGKLKRLSLRSTGLRGQRSRPADRCFQSNICTGEKGDKNCPSCRFKEFVKLAEREESGFPSRPQPQFLDPYCYTLDVEDTELVLSDKYLGVADCKLIATWLDNICRKYTKLKLNGNLLSGSMPHKWDRIDVDVSGIEALGSVIHKLENLQEIDLSGNLLGSNALLAFAAPVEGGSPLSGGLSVKQGVFRVLDISDNRIDAEGWRDFLVLCSQGDIPIKHMGNGVSVIAKRNPILWTTSASRPSEQDLVGIFPMKEFRQKTYAKVANRPDVDSNTGIRNAAVSLRRIAEDDRSDAATASERESSKTDEFPFKIVGLDVHFTEQAFVKVTGTPLAWLKIWEESCDYLSRTRISGLDISDCGMASMDPRYLKDNCKPVDLPRQAVTILAKALAKAETHSEGCAISILTIDSTSNPDDPVHYTLSADFRYESIDREWDISDSPCTWDEMDSTRVSKAKASHDAIRAWRADSSRDHPGPHQLDLQHAQLGPDDAILVCTWLTLKHVRTQIKQVFVGHVESDITSSSIGVRGKFQLARVLGGYTEAVGAQRPHWDFVNGPTLVETVQIDLSDRVLKLQSNQTSIPATTWELRDLMGMGVADVCFLTGWIRNSSVRLNLRRLEVYSTGAGSREVGDYGAVKYSLGFAPAKDGEHQFKREEILRNKNLGPADSGLLAAWLAKEDTRKQLKSIDISENRFLFDFETTKEERKQLLHMQPFESWADFCESLEASAVTEIRVGETRLSPTPARLLFRSSTNLHVLDVQGNPITGEDLVDPATSVAVHTDHLCAMTALRELVQASEMMYVLDLSRCELNAAALHELASPADAWANSSIQTLLLDGNPLTTGDFGTATALTSLHDDRPVATLQAQTDHEDCSGTAALFGALSHPGTRVTELDLSYCGLGARSADAMAEALHGAGIQQNLRTLRLTGNHLGGIVIDELSDGTLWWVAPPPSSADVPDSLANVKLALSQTHITDLDLANCGLGPLNIKSIAQALSDTESTILRTLSKLNVVGNPLTGTFWEKDPSWCCICSNRCQRKCSACKHKVAVCGTARATRRFFCLACANAQNERRSKSIEDLRRALLAKEEADEDFKLNEPDLYARIQWDLGAWIARPIEVKAATIDVTVVNGSFELNEDLSVRRLDPKSDLTGSFILDNAGVTIGMYLVSFQGKPVKPGVKWTVLRYSIKATKRPWNFKFSSRPPGSIDMDVTAVLDLARNDNLTLDTPSSAPCVASALRSQLLQWRNSLKKRSLADKAAAAEKLFGEGERHWADCQTSCQPWCKCRMQYDVDIRGIEALAKSLCGQPKAESSIRELDISSCHVGAFGILAFCGAVMTKKDVSKAHPHEAKEIGFYTSKLSWQTGQEERAEAGAGLKLKGWSPRMLARTVNTPGASELLAPGVKISIEPAVQWNCLDGRPDKHAEDERLEEEATKGPVDNWMYRTQHATGRLTRLTVDSTGIVGYPQVYTLDSLDEHIDVSNKSLGPADAELLSCWLSKPDVAALGASLDLSNNPSLLGEVWHNRTPVWAGQTVGQQGDADDGDIDDESNLHGTLKQPDDEDGVEAFRVLCNGRRKDQPTATVRGLETTFISELNLGNIGMGSVGCEVFCNVVGEKSDFSSGIRQLLLPRNGTDSGIGVQGGKKIAYVIELPDVQGMDNLEEVVLANDLTIPVRDAESPISALDFTTWTLKEDQELRRLANIYQQGDKLSTARERWERIAQEFPKAGAHLLHNDQWPRRGPDMLRHRFELLEAGSPARRPSPGTPTLALTDRSESDLMLRESSSALTRTRPGTAAATSGGLSRSDSVRAGLMLQRQRSSCSVPRTLASEFVRNTPGSQLLQLSSKSDTSSSIAQHDEVSQLPQLGHMQHEAGDQSPRFATNDAKGIGPGEALVLAAAIGRLDRLCTFSAQTTGLGLRVDRWHSKAYSLNAPGSADYPREKVDRDGNVVDAFGEEGTPMVDRLDLSGINFGPYDLQILTRWLLKPEVLPMLTSLNLSKNPVIGQSWLPDDHIAAFIPFIELLADSNIKELRMANIGMGFEGAVTCVQLLDSRESGDEKFRMLQLLDVSGNPLTDTGKIMLHDAARKRLPGQSIVVLDQGEDLSYLPGSNFDKPKPKAKRYECRRDMPVSSDVEPESKKLGYIQAGAYVDALEERSFGGSIRVHFSLDSHNIGAEGQTGWVSKVTDKGLKALFQVERVEKPAENEPEPEHEVDESKPVEITVRELHGKTHRVLVAPAQTVGFLKSLLAERTEFTVDEQQLLVAEAKNGPINLPLEDDTRALAECGLSRGGEMLLVGDEHEIAIAHAQAALIRALSVG